MRQFPNSRNVLVTLLGIGVLLSAPVAAEVTVEDAWARATPPGARTGAVYFTLNNDGPADALIGARTAVAERAELHTHVHADGMMRMEPVASIAVASEGSAVLKPHGDHLMLVGLRQALVAGETVAIELEFESGASHAMNVSVRDARQR